ncbi:MAG: glutaredoxin family protein [Chloroflexi bacterium]|nr:glutaredoxin family protein [Chloroflexota bacterium]
MASQSPLPTTVRLYTKPVCPLCDDARDLLDDLAEEFALAVEVVDITADPTLFARFRTVIPVVEIADAGHLSAPLDRARLTRFLAAAGVHRRRGFWPFRR